MGGVDEEPPSKRVKVSTFESIGFSDNSSFLSPHIKELTNPSSCLMEKHSSLNGKEVDMIGSKGIIKRIEFVRIITKELYALGYEKSGRLLEEESGIKMQSAIANLFRNQLLDGKWDESLLTLHHIGVTNQSILKSVAFLIMEQKFLELLNCGREMEALKTLRCEISPLSVDTMRVHKLAACVVSPSQCTSLTGFRGKDFSSGRSRFKLLEELQKLIPSTIMVPERRLEELVEQAIDVQIQGCMFHNALKDSLSLYTNHQCGWRKIPSQCSQVLEAHSDDIWFLRFSSDGKYLASSSKDKTAIIWEVQTNGVLTLKHLLKGHETPVMMLAWSPDNRMILTCGLEDVVRSWDIETGECAYVYAKSGVNIISCGWFPDGKSIITGMSDHSICKWESGKEVSCWKGERTILISDIVVTTNGKWMITISKPNRILLFDNETNTEKVIDEDQAITSFSLSRNNNFLLVNVLNEEIHLWRIKSDLKFVGKFVGHVRSRFVIRSCFGGVDDHFVASGSEDSQVYIWHLKTFHLVTKLPGHSGTVNCVTWNPVNPHMLASGSDDHTIRIWGIDNNDDNEANASDPKRKGLAIMKNKTTHANGNSK